MAVRISILLEFNSNTLTPSNSWLFIIDSVITFPIALYGFIVFPDVPATTTAFYLSEEASKIHQWGRSAECIAALIRKYSLLVSALNLEKNI